MKATIENSWNQVDGGTRYEVKVGEYTVTVDRENGKNSGFVRGNCPDEKTVLQAAFNVVNSSFVED